MTEVVQWIQAPEKYRVTREHLFPSVQSFAWFVRKNRDELVAAGALTRPTGRWLVQPDAFDLAVLAIGKRRAQSA